MTVRSRRSCLGVGALVCPGRGSSYGDLYRPTHLAGDPGRVPGERRRVFAATSAAWRSGHDAGWIGHVAGDAGGDPTGSRVERATALSVRGLAVARSTRDPVGSPP